jgi:LysR family transcriptional regulator for metE and metH
LEHLLIYAVPKEELSIYQKILVPAGVSPKQLSRVELTEAIIEMVKAGLGIGVMARWAVRPHLEAGTLRAVPLTARGFYRRWSAAMLRHKATPEYVSSFVELLGSNSIVAS